MRWGLNKHAIFVNISAMSKLITPLNTDEKDHPKII